MPRTWLSPSLQFTGYADFWHPTGRFDVAPDHLNGMPIRAAHAGQLAGVMIPYSWILR
jgi:hypothetical protein